MLLAVGILAAGALIKEGPQYDNVLESWRLFNTAFFTGALIGFLGWTQTFRIVPTLSLKPADRQPWIAAFALGLATSNPDDIDWADETRIAIEERVSMSPDALTGMEANLRFNGPENMITRVFGRLTAWQNWIFQRPNAVGEKGALKVFGKGDKAQFDWNRV